MRILLLTALCAFTLKPAAQDFEKSIPGLRLGYSANRALYKTPETQNSRWVHGAYAGLQIKIPFDNRLYFKPFIDVHYRGMELETALPDQYRKIEEVQIRVAPLLHLQISGEKNKPGGWFVHAGPSIGFGVWGRQTRQDGNNNAVTQNLKYGFQSYGRYDFTIHVGLGYETRGGLQLHADYNHGMSNMINTEFGPLLKFRYLSGGISIPLRK